MSIRTIKWDPMQKIENRDILKNEIDKLELEAIRAKRVGDIETYERLWDEIYQLEPQLNELYKTTNK